jgi:hypothetical protein
MNGWSKERESFYENVEFTEQIHKSVVFHDRPDPVPVRLGWKAQAPSNDGIRP